MRRGRGTARGPNAEKRWETERATLNPVRQMVDDFVEEVESIAVSAVRDSPGINIAECLRTIEENEVTFITTDTGTGKSTLIPLALMQQDPVCNIVILVPRRISAMQLATRVSSKLNSVVGEEVGFSVRGESYGTLGITRVMFITSYSLLLFLLRTAPEEIPFDYIIVDEFHERAYNIQLTALLIRAAMRMERLKPNFRLIFSSATSSIDDWKDFFSDFRVGHYQEATENYSIREFYGQEICDLCGSQLTPLDLTNTNAALEVLMCRLYQTLEMIAERVADRSLSVLVFLPGRSQVEGAHRWIKKNHNNRFYPVMWHREVDLSEVEDALNARIPDKSKVYLATEVAEVSLTLPDAAFIIDTCLNKRKRVDFSITPTICFPPLELCWISTANAKQRRGRVGRVRCGIYMSLLSKEDHDNLQPDMGRAVDIDESSSVVLHSLFATSYPADVLSKCCNPADSRMVQFTLSSLSNDGLIIPSVNFRRFTPIQNGVVCFGSYHSQWESDIALENTTDAYSPSLMGFIVAHVPTSLSMGVLVYYGYLTDTLKESIFLASVEAAMFTYISHYDDDRDLQETLLQDAKEEMLSMSRALGSHGQEILMDDLLSCASAVIEFMNVKDSFVLDEEIANWCEHHHLNRTRAQDAVTLYEHMLAYLRSILPIEGDAPITHENLSEKKQILHAISIASHTTHASYTLNDSGESVGYFIHFKCRKNRSPTVCSWLKGRVVIPLSMFPGSFCYFGSFTLESSVCQFGMTLLALSTTVSYCVLEEYYAFKVKKFISDAQFSEICFSVPTGIASRLLVLRHLLLFKLSLLSKSMTNGSDLEDGGFPADWIDNPDGVCSSIGAQLIDLIYATPEEGVVQIPRIENGHWRLSVLRPYNVPT